MASRPAGSAASTSNETATVIMKARLKRTSRCANIASQVRHTSSTYLTMVGVDEKGKPCPVPPLTVAGPDEERRQREAEVRRRNRLAERDEIVGHRG